MSIQKKERIKYYDTLRTLAILGIITLHIMMKWQNAEILGLRIYAFSEITRFAVPIFLMMSGALLLNREMSILDFFKRRFSRLCYPYIFYLIIYAIVLFFFITCLPGFEGLSKYFGYMPLKYN